LGVQATSITPAAVSDQNNSSTGYFDLPAGTTAERPAIPTNGNIRYNTTINKLESYQNGEWVSYALAYTADYLMAAGGGGNSSGQGGQRESGSGAGGLLQGTFSFVSGSSYSIIVGSGGSGHANGANTTALGLTAVGGGFGGNSDGMAGAAGGSGGGDWYTDSGGANAGTAGQGYRGGAWGGVNNWTGGGGGGAGGPGGVSPSNTTPGIGGVGVSSSITGSSVTYCTGGRSNVYSGATYDANGASNSGNGASGIGNGGSGIVIIRYLGPQKGTGGTVTSSGGYTIHTFTSSGTFTA
jgi:hypothetical protein